MHHCNSAFYQHTLKKLIFSQNYTKSFPTCSQSIHRIGKWHASISSFHFLTFQASSMIFFCWTGCLDVNVIACKERALELKNDSLCNFVNYLFDLDTFSNFLIKTAETVAKCFVLAPVYWCGFCSTDIFMLQGLPWTNTFYFFDNWFVSKDK